MKNHFYNLRKLIFISMLLIFISACATSGIVAESDPATGKSDVVEIQNSSLAKKVAIKNFNTRVINDLLNVQVEIQNLFDSDQEFQYKFSWFDVTGFEIESEGNSWKTLILHGKETKNVQGLAPNPTVKKYKIVLRQL